MSTSQSLIKKVTDFFLIRVSEEHKMKKEIIECLLSEFGYFKICNLNDLPNHVLISFLNISSKGMVYLDDLMQISQFMAGYKKLSSDYFYFYKECKVRNVSAKEFFNKMFEQGDINQNFKKS